MTDSCPVALKIEFILDVTCTQEQTIDITSADLQLDPEHPDVCPIGHPGFLADGVNNKPVVITKMRKGMELKLKAIAVKASAVQQMFGTGADPE